LRHRLQRLGTALPWLLLGLAHSPLEQSSHAAETIDGPGFVPIFDGRSFDGWKAPDMSYWSVEEGAITGRITRDQPCSTNQYLVWQIGELADFELKLVSRVRGEGAINNGFQFRSRVLPDGDVAGYQVDNNLQTEWLVRLYDEFGRHTLAFRGKRTVFDAEGRTTSRDLPEASGPAWFRLEDWHEYHLICRGPTLTLRVDGRLAAEVEDRDRVRSDLRGALALQLHSGPPSVAQFKDIRLKVLRPISDLPERRWTRAESSRRRQLILAEATAAWDLGAGGHGSRFPLRQVADSDFDVRSQGRGALTGTTVADLRGAWFDAGKDIDVAGPSLTTYLRLRDPAGRWNNALLTRRDSEERFSFRLYGADLPGTPGPDVVFEVHTARGTGRVSFPVSRIDPTAWHDLAGRYDGAQLDLFCDGIRMARHAWSGGALTAGEIPTRVGADGDGGPAAPPFTGQIEEAALWQRALPDAEIATLMRTRELRSPSRPVIGGRR
jgi:hypothetical protein